MKDKGKITLIYSVVAVASVAMIILFRFIADSVPESEMPVASDVGREEVTDFFPVKAEIEMTRQDGAAVKFSDLKGKVTVVAQFFAVCPHCAVRNGAELGEIYERFGDDPDFRIVCISVDPETDGEEELKAYGEALGADPENWWFAAAGEKDETHRFLEEELGFFKIRERTDPVDVASNGRYAHDLAFLVIDKELKVIGKYPLPDLRSDEGQRNFPGGYEKRKAEMFERLQQELDDE